MSKSLHLYESAPKIRPGATEIMKGGYQGRRAATQWLVIDRYGKVRAGTHMAYQDLFGLTDKEVREVP